MDFSNSGAVGKGSLNPSERAALINNVKEQLAMANAQEMLTQINEKCFKLCVQKPGSSLSSSEQKCLNYCMDRFFDATVIVSRAYSQRLQKELANAR